jgi:large subunit ribosomal protein L17
MVSSLLKNERITTTLAKAREVKRTAEKLVTRAKIDSVHNRRIVAKRIKDKELLNKLFTDISVRFNERPGGYTRILKLGPRANDAAPMVILEFVERIVPEKKKKPAKREETEAVVESEKEIVDGGEKKEEEEAAEVEAAKE